MSYKEICFLVYTPLTKRDYARFGVERLENRGFNITVLDLTVLFNPEYGRDIDPSDLVKHLNIFSVSKKKEIFNYFYNKKECFVIDFIGCNYRTAFIYRIFKRLNMSYATFWTNAIPLPSETLVKKLRRIINKLFQTKSTFSGIKEKIEYIAYLLMPKALLLQSPKFILMGGYKNHRRMPWRSRDAKLIWAHSLDYDIYLENRPAADEGKEYAVFLDEYFPFHPDFLIKEVGGSDLDPENYYRGVNVFFSWFERKFGMEVIIAAHPRSRYDLKRGCFPDSKLRYGNTVSLVRGAKYVFAHMSTSIGFAVLYNKPIIFLTSKEFEITRFGLCIDNFSQQFKQKPINVDMPETFNSACKFDIDEKCYQQYYFDYIKTSGSPDKPFWEIVADHIEGASK